MRIATHPLNTITREDPLASFLGHSLHNPNALALAKEHVDSRFYPRKTLAKILEEYNQQLGVDSVSLENARKLAQPNSYCVVTGQQLGMISGPLYTILKGISCLLVARQTGAVPIFWLATEDHDIPEIDHTYLIDELGNLKRFHLSLPRNGSAVEDLVLTSKNIEEIKEFWNYLGLKDRPLPSSGDLYSRSMIQILVSLFAGTGMVFIEPKLLRSLAIPFFSREISECEAIQNILKETANKLELAGGNPSISVGVATNLFFKNKFNKRLKIKWDGSVFNVGSEAYSLNELLKKINETPELFSPNVAARPVLQNTLLPVIAYLAGPTEFNYHYQLGAYHQFHDVTMPCIIPRLSATFIPPEAASILVAYDLNPWSEIPLHKNDIPGHSLHLLRNLIYPHNELQERLLNWWGFQVQSQENLVGECLAQLSWDSKLHYYLYL